MKSRDISELEQALGYQFSRPELLEQAVTHSSQARELESLAPSASTRVGDNEQLEFLGDAVLGLITTEELFHRFPHFREGELSKLRAHLVSEKHLIRVARQLELGDYLSQLWGGGGACFSLPEFHTGQAKACPTSPPNLNT